MDIRLLSFRPLKMTATRRTLLSFRPLKMTATRRTLDCGIYKAALVDAFINITDDFETMNYDIIERVLKGPHMYSDFLESVEYMRLIFM